MAGTNHDSESSAPDGSTTFQNGIIGGIVGLLLFFIPFSPFIGGFTGGYREGRTRFAAAVPGNVSHRTLGAVGAEVGTISGALPFVFFVTGWFYVFFFMLGFGEGAHHDWGPGLILIVGSLLVVLYTIVISAVGGVVGVYSYYLRKTR